MFRTYISMKSHHTKGSGRLSRDETGRGEGNSLYKRAFSRSPSKDKKTKQQKSETKKRKLSKIFEVSVETGEQTVERTQAMCKESVQPVRGFEMWQEGLHLLGSRGREMPLAQ